MSGKQESYLLSIENSVQKFISQPLPMIFTVSTEHGNVT